MEVGSYRPVEMKKNRRLGEVADYFDMSVAIVVHLRIFFKQNRLKRPAKLDRSG